MLRAKFLITLAVIGGIHQFYGDDDTDMAHFQIPAATCAGYSATAIDASRANGLDMDAIGAQGRSCADADIRNNALNG